MNSNYATSNILELTENSRNHESCCKPYVFFYDERYSLNTKKALKFLEISVFDILFFYTFGEYIFFWQRIHIIMMNSTFFFQQYQVANMDSIVKHFSPFFFYKHEKFIDVYLLHSCARNRAYFNFCIFQVKNEFEMKYIIVFLS